MDRGYAGFSIAEVAALAGVTEAAIARRGWSRPQLIVAAARQQFGGPLPCPEEGSLRADLIVIMERQDQLAGIHRRLVDRIMEAARGAVEFRSTIEDVTRERRRAFRPVFEHTVARGELAADCDVNRAFDLVFGPFWSRYLEGRDLDPTMAEQLVDLALEGLERNDMTDTTAPTTPPDAHP